MYLLDKLWRGDIAPSERFVRKNSEYSQVAKRFCDEIETFLSDLSPEAKKQMEIVDSLRAEMNYLHEEDIFIYGFRMGARMILDVVGDYKGQFYDVGEAG